MMTTEKIAFKDVIDGWQKDFPDKFPAKPAPKVYFSPNDAQIFVKHAQLHYDASPKVAAEAMELWQKGQRWKEAVLKHCKETGEECPDKKTSKKKYDTEKNVFAVISKLKESFPKLFDEEKPVLLRINIHSKLNSWRKENGVKWMDLKLALAYWVSREKYKELKEASKTDESIIRYGLDMERYASGFPIRRLDAEEND